MDKGENKGGEEELIEVRGAPSDEEQGTDTTVVDFDSYIVRFRPSDNTTYAKLITHESNQMLWGVKPLTAYYVSVAARDINGNTSAFSTDASIYTPSDETRAPDVPSGLVLTTGATLASDGNGYIWINANWNDSTASDLDYYTCRYRPADRTTYSDIGTPVSETEINAIRPSTAYYVSVSAVDFMRNYSAYCTDVSIFSATDNYPPAVPTDFSVSANYLVLNLKWTNPIDKDLRWIEVWRADASNNRAIATKVASTSSSFWTDPVLVSGITKYYWIRAADYADLSSAWVPTDAPRCALDFKSDLGVHVKIAPPFDEFL